MSRLYLIVFTVILLNSCCGEDIKVGELYIDETSKSFFPYDGEEELIFENENGDTILLVSNEGIQNDFEKYATKELCGKWPYQQEEYYDKERISLEFSDTTQNIVFAISMDIIVAINSDTLPLEIDVTKNYDRLVLNGRVDSTFFGNMNLITHVNGDISESHKKELNHIWEGGYFIGDTILYGVAFDSVYTGPSLESQEIFYTKEQGLVAIKISPDSYFVRRE